MTNLLETHNRRLLIFLEKMCNLKMVAPIDTKKSTI